MSLLFEKRDNLDVVNGVLVEPEEKTTQKWKLWKKKESEAKYYISTALDDHLIKHVLTCKNSKEMWKTLCCLYEKRSEARIMMLQRKLINLKMSPKEKASDYIAEAKNLAYQLQKSKEPVSNELLQTMIIDGLPLTKYIGFVLEWKDKKGSLIGKT